MSTASADPYEWGVVENVPMEVIMKLEVQGITSVSQLRQLSDQDVDTFFQTTGLLLTTECSALKAALNRLTAPSGATSYDGR